MTRWRKTTRSGPNGNCVELAHTRDLIRDSKNPTATLNVDVAALLVAVKALPHVADVGDRRVSLG